VCVPCAFTVLNAGRSAPLNADAAPCMGCSIINESVGRRRSSSSASEARSNHTLTRRRRGSRPTAGRIDHSLTCPFAKLQHYTDAHRLSRSLCSLRGPPRAPGHDLQNILRFIIRRVARFPPTKYGRFLSTSSSMQLMLTRQGPPTPTVYCIYIINTVVQKSVLFR